MDSQTPDRSSKNAPTAAEWFYTQRGEVYGPVSSADLRAAAHLGFVGPNDMIRRGEHGPWEAARSFRGLFKEAG